MIDKAIGGYFGLELWNGEHYHKDAIKLNTARNCFEYILRTRHYRKVYIPYYTCEVMLQPLQKCGIEWEFYHIDKCFEPVGHYHLKADEAFLYTNYWGLKQKCVERLATEYDLHLIVDNAQAFYSPRIEGIDTFYSCRKFFGVADGAYLYTDSLLNDEFEQDRSFTRMQHLLQRIDDGASAGYAVFRANDDALTNQPIRKMSNLTDSLMSSINYEVVKRQRRANFEYLHKILGSNNGLYIPEIDNIVCPMIYPYLTSDAGLKKRLIENKIFVATYWPNVFESCELEQLEYHFADRIIAMPIDQRYGIEDMHCIVKIINIK